jgi:hypothetical protein
VERTTVAGQILSTEIINKEDNDVRTIICEGRLSQKKASKNKEEKPSHWEHFCR